MTFNKHYLTYPLIVIAAVAAIYFSGVHHQQQLDKAKATADSASTRAIQIIKAKAHDDSVATDSLAKQQIKIDTNKKVTVILSRQRDSLIKQVSAAKDTTQLVVALKAQVSVDDSLLKSKDSTIADQDKSILFLKSEIVRKDNQFIDLANLNADTN